MDPRSSKTSLGKTISTLCHQHWLSNRDRHLHRFRYHGIALRRSLEVPPFGHSVVGIDKALDASQRLMGSHKRALPAFGPTFTPVTLNRCPQGPNDLGTQLPPSSLDI